MNVADFYFNDVSIIPNPVNTDEEYAITVDIKDKQRVLQNGNNAILTNGETGLIMLPDTVKILIDSDGIALAVDENGTALER